MEWKGFFNAGIPLSLPVLGVKHPGKEFQHILSRRPVGGLLYISMEQK